MKEAATKSKPFSTPNFRSPMSFSVKEGNVVLIPGRFTPLLLLIFPLFFTVQTTSVSVILSTFNSTNPSSIKTASPGFKSFTIPLCDTVA